MGAAKGFVTGAVCGAAFVLLGWLLFRTPALVTNHSPLLALAPRVALVLRPPPVDSRPVPPPQWWLPHEGRLHEWSASQPQHDTHSSKIAVIIESRPLPRLVRAVQQFWGVLEQEGWEFQVWYSAANEAFLRADSWIQTSMRTGRLRLYPIGVKTDGHFLNKMFVSNTTFWEFIGQGTGNDTKILIFQIDSCLCLGSPHKLAEFMHYDYIGAPWRAPWYSDSGGNGGLSLRSRSAMIECSAAPGGEGAAFRSGANSEDNFFTDCIARAEARGERRISHRPHSERFAVETIYYPRPWGVHKAWSYLPRDELERLERDCPEMADARRVPIGGSTDGKTEARMQECRSTGTDVLLDADCYI